MKATTIDTKTTTTVTYITSLIAINRLEWLPDYATKNAVKEIGTMVETRESKAGFYLPWRWNGFGAENFRVEKVKLTREITTVETRETED